MKAENTHHEYSPSALDKFAACPRYRRNEGTGGEYAERGTLVHAAAAGDETAATQLTDDEKRAVDFWHETLGNQHFPLESIERRLTLVDDDFTTITEGTADLCHAEPDAGFVLLADMKNGEPHDYFWQMAAYAAAAIQTTGLPECRVLLVYARLRRVEERTVAASDLPKIIAGIKGIIAAAESGVGEYGKGEQCQWCGNQLTCPALTGAAAEIVKGYEPEMLPANWHPSEIAEPEQMAKMLTLAAIVEKWAKSVKHHATAMALTGADLPGWSLVERKPRAKIVNAQAAFERSGLNATQFLTAVSVSLPDLAKAVAAAEGVSTYKARKKIETALADVIERGKPSQHLKAAKGGGLDENTGEDGEE